LLWSAHLYDSLLREVLLVAQSLIVEGLAVLENMKLIFIEFGWLICSDGLIHHFLGLIFYCELELPPGQSTSGSPTEVFPLDV